MNIIESMGAEGDVEPRLEISPTACFLENKVHVGPGVNVARLPGDAEQRGLCATGRKSARTNGLDMATNMGGSTDRGCGECSEVNRSEENEMQSLHLQMLMILNRTPP